MNHRIEVCINRTIGIAVEYRDILYLHIISLSFTRETKQRKKANTYEDYKKKAKKVFNVVIHDYII